MGIIPTAIANATKKLVSENSAKLDEINIRGDKYKTEQVFLNTNEKAESVSSYQASISFPVLNNGNMRKKKFYNNGLKLVGISTAYVLKTYTLTTPYDVTTAQEDYNHIDLAGFTYVIEDFDLDSTGLNLYILDHSGTSYTISHLILDNPFDFKSFTESNNLILSGTEMDNLTIKPDGTGGIVSEQGSIAMLNMPTPNSLVGATVTNSASLSTGVFTGGGQREADQGRVSKDGLKFYRLDWTNTSTSHSRIVEFTFGTAWDTTTISLTGETILNNIGPIEECEDIEITHDGSKILCGLNSAFFILNLGTNYDSSTATYGGGRPLEDFWGEQLAGVSLSPDGTKMLVASNDRSTRMMCLYELDTPFDMQTKRAVQVASFPNAASDPAFAVTGEGSDINYIKLCDGGSKIVSKHNDILKISVMTTPYDLDTLVDTFTPNNVNMNTALGYSFTAQGMWIEEDGTRFFATRTSPSNGIFYCNLATPFNFNSRSGVILDTTNYTYSPRRIAVNNNGTSLLIENISNESLYLHTLSTAYNPSTESLAQTYTLQYSSNTYPFLGNNNLVGLSWEGNSSQYVFCVNGSGVEGIFKLISDVNSINSYDGDYFCPPPPLEKIFIDANIEFNKKGDTLFVAYNGGRIDQFNLTTPFNYLTATRAYRRNVYSSSSSSLSPLSITSFTMTRDSSLVSNNRTFYASSGAQIYMARELSQGYTVTDNLYGKFTNSSNTAPTSLGGIYTMRNYLDKILVVNTSSQTAIVGINSVGNIQNTLFDGPVSHGGYSPRTGFMKPDGGRIFLMDNGRDLRVFAPSTPYDLVNGELDLVDSIDLINYSLIPGSNDNPNITISDDGQFLFMINNSTSYIFKLSAPFTIQPAKKVFELTGKNKIQNIRIKRNDYNGEYLANLGLEAIIDNGEKRNFYSTEFNGNANSPALVEPIDIRGFDPAFDTSFELHATINDEIALEITYRDES